MPYDYKRENREDIIGDNEGIRARKEWRMARMLIEREIRKERRRERKKQRPLTRYIFWGLMLILWGILLFSYGQGWVSAGDIWKVFLCGLGAIFIIQAVVYFLDPLSRSTAIGRLVTGIILLIIGLNLLVNFAVGWPLALVIAGIAVIFITWFLQREIEKRKVTQETLHQSEVKYRHIIDNANSVIMEIDTRGNITFINKYALDFFGFQESEILGHNVVGTIAASTVSASQEQDKMIEDIARTPEAFLNSEKENLLKNGEKVWIIWTYKPIYDEENNLKEILCIGIDRTEHKRTEEMLAQRLKEETAVEERTRLARDLHDAVSQTLFSASLMADVLPRVWEKNKEEGLKKLEEVRQLTRGALAEMRTLLFELRPAALADAELSDLLHQLAESVMGRALLPVTLEVEGTCKIPTDVKVALYRIAQEALNNIVKHSGATRAQVTLQCQPDEVNLHIIDNGQGFDVSQVTAGSFGLGNMSERANHISALLKIESRVNEGTEITVVWHNKAEEVSQ
jgi:PAS domain S-box-containing protein